MEVLKEQYNIILARIKKGEVCCKRLDLSKKEDRIKFKRYSDKIMELAETGNNILLDLEQLGVNVTAKEVQEGFKL